MFYIVLNDWVFQVGSSFMGCEQWANVDHASERYYDQDIREVVDGP